MKTVLRNQPDAWGARHSAGLRAKPWRARLVSGAIAFGLILLGQTVSPSVSAAPEEGAPAETAKSAPDSPKLPEFSIIYDVGLVASEKSAHVKIRLGAGSEPVEWIRFRFDPMRYRAFSGNGELVEIEGGIEWRPPARGGVLRYVFSIDHLRNGDAYDSRCAKSWAIFRGEDLVPRMRTRTSPIARSKSRLRLRLPEGWSAAVPYRRITNGDYEIDERRTRIDRPSGWFAFGKLGVVRDTIESARVAVAGPAGQGVRRHDMLAMLKWNLPALSELFGRLPKRLQIISAGDPMWRGGLSGPNSIYLHADRPLIGEDSSSPILHELMHSLMRARAGSDGDWVVEGIAELYSLELLRRSKTLSEARYQAAIESFRKRARGGGRLRARSVTGDTRAKAVVVLLEINEAIYDASGRVRSLDDVVRGLADLNDPITTENFRKLVFEAAGEDLSDVFAKHDL